MKNKPIILVAGDPNSVFLEIFFKAIKLNRYKSPLILICNINNLKKEMKTFNFKKKLKLIELNELNKIDLNNNSVNIINVSYKKNLNKNMKSDIIKIYIDECFKVAFKLIKKGVTNKLINGPINKKNFLNKKFFGITEYIANHFKEKNVGMLIYNNNLSVCPKLFLALITFYLKI